MHGSGIIRVPARLTPPLPRPPTMLPALTLWCQGGPLGGTEGRLEAWLNGLQIRLLRVNLIHGIVLYCHNGNLTCS